MLPAGSMSGLARAGLARWASDGFLAGIQQGNALRYPAQVRARGEPSPDDKSIAAHLLRIRDPETGAPLADDLLAGEFGLFFSAGLESAGNALTWTVYAPLQVSGLNFRVFRVTFTSPLGRAGKRRQESVGNALTWTVYAAPQVLGF